MQITLTVAKHDLAEFMRSILALVGETRAAQSEYKAPVRPLGEQQPLKDQAILLNTRQVAKLLNLSPTTIWAMEKSGGMPKAARIGRAVRWRFDALKDWVIAGCPNQHDWKKRRPK